MTNTVEAGAQAADQAAGLSGLLDSAARALLGGVLDGYLYPFILEGMVLTLELAFLSLLISIVLGMMGAVAKLSKSKTVRLMAGVYTTLVRGVPDIVLMFVLFFGGQIIVNQIGDSMGWDYIEISEFAAGSFTLGFIFGAYMTETFRGGILAVSRGEIEAGHAFGMTPVQVFFRITLPSSIRHALPSFGNNWLVLAKATALVSVIGLEDMVFRAGQAGNSLRQPFTFFLAVAILYLVITAVSDVGLRWANKRYSVGVRRA
jgi:arginine/ornithine transport system permease protein